MKKVGIASAGVVALMLFLCTACGGSTKMPDDLIKTAIQNQNDEYSTYGLNITDFTVSDRSYDKQYKTEDVTVDIMAENGESTYKATYDVMGSRESGNWSVSSVQTVDTTILPKAPLPNEIVEAEAEKILQEEKNERYNLTEIGYCDYTSALEQSIEVDMQLCSDTPYMRTTKDCTLNYQYSLNGWNLASISESNVDVQITDDLCGTWTASNGDDSYKFVIDHIDGDMAYVKYQAQMLMPKYGWSTESITRGYDTLTPVQISVVYHDWESPYYGLEIAFEKTRYAQYGMFDDPLTIGMRIYPRVYKERKYSNGTVEDGMPCVIAKVSMPDTTKPVNGLCILSKQ